MDNISLTKDKTGRIRTLQASRFLFVFLIYLSHSVLPLAGSPFDFGGESGVAFFFVLSGFVLCCGYGNKVVQGEFSTSKFFWRHFWRLYPLHLLLFVATVFLDWRIGHVYDLAQLMAPLLLVQSWIPSNHTLFVANGVSWFLCDTLFFYAVFACIFKTILRLPLASLAWVGAGLAIVYAAVAINVPSGMVNCTLYSNPLLRTVDFSLGILAWRMCSIAPSACHADKALLSAKMFPVADIVLLLVAYMIYQIANTGVRCSMLFWPVMPLVVARLAVADTDNRNCFVRFLHSRPMQWLGAISFEIFMCHLLVMRLVQHAIGVDGSIWRAALNFVVAFAATIVVAWVLHKCYVNQVYDVIKRHLLRY